VLAYYRSIFSLRGRLLLRRTSVPALYLHGDDDGCADVELCDGVEAAYRAGVRVCRVRGAGHFVQLEQPEIFNQALLKLIDEPPVGPSPQ
jgi:pimeloyl-ACP methyl ester carboxylesterase